MSELAGFSSRGAASTALTTDNASASNVARSPTATTQAPDETNIFLAAQKGDMALLQSLISRGLATAGDRDSCDVTPLHWAAINNELAACEYLIQAGAEVDALGGDLVSTPLQWAAREGRTYIIQLLLQHGADPSICDAQGYNTLHLVTHSSKAIAVLYVLQHSDKVPVDSRDSNGHTALMWAAYQGDSLLVNLLLKHGASVSAVDTIGLTPLHWSVVGMNRICIRRLVEWGADLNARDQDGRTPRDLAVEFNIIYEWQKALEGGEFEEDGSNSKPLNEGNTKLATKSYLHSLPLKKLSQNRPRTWGEPMNDGVSNILRIGQIPMPPTKQYSGNNTPHAGEAAKVEENDVSDINRGIYGLQLNGSRISLLSCHHFPLAELVEAFIQEHSMERPVDSVVVKSALYGKKLKSPHHEFILFELGNTQDPCLRNHVVLDRNRLDGANILSSIQTSRSAAARDEFRFSCDGNLEKLLSRCDLTPYDTIETLEFIPGGLLPFYELAIVALATSLQRNHYHLLDANCYWFAGLIWEQVLEMYPEAKHEVLRDGVRGKFGSLFSYAPDEFEQEDIGIKVQAMLPQMEAIMTGVWPTSAEDSCRMNSRDRYDDADAGSSSAPNALNTGSPESRNTITLVLNLPQSPNTLERLSESTNQTPCAHSERHRQIFPAGFDNISSSSTQQSFCSFPPELLYDILTSNYNPELHVEDIIVQSASYCRKNASPKHDFILLEVEDRKSSGLRNFIVLSRNLSKTNRPTGIFSTLQIFQLFPASKDEFRVSYDGDKKRLLVQCNLQDYETLETLVFKPNEPMLLYQLATLTRILPSDPETSTPMIPTPNYSLFTGFIWDCMIRLRPSVYHKVVRGAFLSRLRQDINRVQLQVFDAYIEKELLGVEKRFAIQKQLIQWSGLGQGQVNPRLSHDV